MKAMPTKAEILDWIRDNPHSVGKREIARAFGLKGAERVALKRMLGELEDEGHIRNRRRKIGTHGHLPPVTVLIAEAPDSDGDLFARPKDWEGEHAPPRILYVPRRNDPALREGDRFLAKLHPVEDREALAYEARLIKKIGAGPRRMLGIFRAEAEGGRVVPVDKKSDREWLVPPGATRGAAEGELVEAHQIDGARMGLPRAKIAERVGDPGRPRQLSLIAIHQYDIPYDFPDTVLAEAEAAIETGPEGRTDLRALPLVTIDPEDARDHDDAVCAMADDDPANPEGHVVWVAIADVAAYVRPGSALDREAHRRGNSTYFPDRVAPMLPERLSGDLCSLHAGVDRPCLAVRLVLDRAGEVTAQAFHRGVMRSRASLTYEQAQSAAEGEPDAATAPLAAEAIAPLFAAYRAAARARDRRQPLDLDLPERRIELDDAGTVTAIPIRERLDAHRLIEEFMILANVAAATTLEARRRALLYRVHEEPDPEKLDTLRESVESIGLTLAKGQVTRTSDLNRLLAEARKTEAEELISLQVLRAQTQAYYSAENLGHFGLNLRAYAHFTSPIRRYADLVVHRALIAALGLGGDGQTREEADALPATAEHVSLTERRSMEAERDTTDRYVAHYMAEREGAEFWGKISGVARFGLFVKLDETGADGLVPVSTLGREYFAFDPEHRTLTGERSGKVLALGMRARVRLVEATPVTGGLIFDLLEAVGVAPRSDRPETRRAAARKPARQRAARAKAKRKARRD